MRISLLSEVFPEPGELLAERLSDAREAGAVLTVLPELPLDPWWPAGERAADEAAEAPGGPRHERLADAARTAGMALVGGAIVRDPDTGTRRNTALVFDAGGELIASYAKTHLPHEPGFWETAHYEPGSEPPELVPGFELTLGLQICSDVQRPSGCELLAAHGVAAILHPRATERASWPRWRRVLQANAQCAACYVLSVNRAGPDGVGIGGPSLVVDPDGEVALESEEALVIAELDAEAVRAARRGYPGYLDRPGGVYAKGWSALGPVPGNPIR